MMSSINTLLLDITYRCNLNCKHCYNGKLLSINSDMHYGDFLKIIRENRIKHIHLLGGEPLQYRQLGQLISRHQDIIFTINTNGLGIERAIKDGLFTNKNLKEVVVSLDGYNSADNDTIRGQGTFNRVIENLQKLDAHINDNSLDIKISIATVITTDNIDGLLNARFEIFNKGFTLLFSTLYYSGNAITNYRYCSDSYYRKCIRFFDMLVNEIEGFDVRIDSNPLVLNLLNLKYQKCVCNNEKMIRYSDNKGRIYMCNPDKLKFSLFSTINLDSFCKDCPYLYLCSECKFGLYFKRVEYCKAALKYFYNKKYKLSENYAIKTISDKVYIINKATKVLKSWSMETFHENIIIEDNILRFINYNKKCILEIANIFKGETYYETID